jgi:hypothetical protein
VLHEFLKDPEQGHIELMDISLIDNRHEKNSLYLSAFELISRLGYEDHQYEDCGHWRRKCRARSGGGLAARIRYVSLYYEKWFWN